jgi:uncharacterized protein
MARFAAILTFGEEAARLAVRPRHREYLQSLLDAGKLHLSGPWADDSGALIVYEAPDLAAAQALLAADPYIAAGVLADVQLREWKVIFSA